MRKLPDFPWDRLTPYKEIAGRHAGGMVDLSVGTPVDPTPEPIRRALAEAADAPGYPQTYGTPALREAVAGWLRRTLGVSGADPAAVLPVIGTKELVAWLPTLLGAGPGDRVVFPELAYPTYDVGARLAGAEPVPADGLLTLGPAVPKIVWVNSPSNPTGRVLPAEHLRKVVSWARERGAVVVSDECYIELVWDETPGRQPVSILHPDVCGGSHEGLLAIHSLSKRSNMAGYRAGFVTGDPALVKRLLEVRKHAGMIVPAPVQAAMTAAYGDDAHVAEQRARYARRREALRAALVGHGFRIDHSEASLYLWATRDEPCWDTVEHLAGSGILVAPGDFYGPAGGRHVRVAFTATDERVAAAVQRL
ncbi:succinyldiaminopimelate transaminase [Thermomonospora umbrina]|uniref:Aminotransferase n=1 Tax=Thermomonospora umbrina TaxID=111806 RepID=A0A3D9SSQ0_9ACTN|nr:succinyldiaminopimelate transaminase [Thermomonospora umbrina]REE95995.1 succinyldiaminopimelate aminotransferase [Thermomonospora umbrina]